MIKIAVRDVLWIAVFMFALAIGLFAIHFMLNQAVDKMLEIEQINESSKTVTAFGNVKSLTNKLDYFIFGVFIALILGLIVTSWFIAGHPIYMFAYFLVVVISVVISTVLANSWETISQSSIFGNTVVSFTLTNNLMMNLPLYIAVIGFIGIVLMFAKPAIEK